MVTKFKEEQNWIMYRCSDMTISEVEEFFWSETARNSKTVVVYYDTKFNNSLLAIPILERTEEGFERAIDWKPVKWCLEG